MMICTCNECRFMFKGSNSMKRCPDCGAENIRPATDMEYEEYLAYQKEFYPQGQTA